MAVKKREEEGAHRGFVVCDAMAVKKRRRRSTQRDCSLWRHGGLKKEKEGVCRGFVVCGAMAVKKEKKKEHTEGLWFVRRKKKSISFVQNQKCFF